MSMEEVGVNLTEATDMLGFGVKELHGGNEEQRKLATMCVEFSDAIAAVGAVAARIRMQVEKVDAYAIRSGQWMFEAVATIRALNTDDDSVVEAGRRAELAGDMCCNDLGSIVGKNALLMEGVDEIVAKLATLEQFAQGLTTLAEDTSHVESIETHVSAAGDRLGDYAAATGVEIDHS